MCWARLDGAADHFNQRGVCTAHKIFRMEHYRGSPKHKDRPSQGRKGTLCPEWTHVTGVQGFNGEPHPWSVTVAQALFAAATHGVDGRRYATARGIAFEAKPTGDGSWHGFPVPWESVPPAILGQWLSEGKVTRRDVRLNRRHEATNIHWALDTDAT